MRRERPEPSAFIEYISPFPSWPVYTSTFKPLSDLNAMRRPSGDQDGYRLLVGRLLVRRARPEPSAFIEYIWIFPSSHEVNAMRRPSGDQDRSPDRAELWVSRATPEPSAFIVYISPVSSL